MSADEGEPQQPRLSEALPVLARAAAGAWWRTAWWSLGASARVGSRITRAALYPDEAARLVDDLSNGLRSYAREFLGVADLDDRVKQLMPPPGTFSRRGRRNGLAPAQSSLRVQGAELLRKAADVSSEDGAHPAYARILTELAPDEARILRLLAVEGPQALVDVRATNLIGVGSQLIAPALNMIGAQAGLRHRDRVPPYLNNLERLGLIELFDAPLEDPIAYQVLEAQPDVLEAIKGTTRAKTIRRSIRLTPFGRDFCDVCLPLETAEIEALVGED